METITTQQPAATKHARNSSVELLRLFSLLGITLCHIMGSGDELIGFNRYVVVAGNSFFNAGTGVICFMLITGYYGLKLSAVRFNKIYSIIYSCAMAHLAYTFIIKEPSFEVTVHSLIPVSSSKWWYASCYIFTLLLSPFLNMVIERLSKKEFTCLIFVSIFLFYVIPTFLYFDIMNDRGKGLAAMIVVYFIGAYLRKYPVNISSKRLFAALLILLLMMLAGNIAGALILDEACWPFSRDCTATTLAAAVIEFLLALKFNYSSKAINLVSSKTFYMFLLANVTQRHYIPIDGYSNSLLFFPICAANALITVALAFVISLVLQYAARLIEIILNAVERLIVKLFKSKPAQKLKNKLFNFLKTEINV